MFTSEIKSPEGVRYTIVQDVSLKCLASKISDVDRPQIRSFMERWGDRLCL